MLGLLMLLLEVQEEAGHLLEIQALQALLQGVVQNLLQVLLLSQLEEQDLQLDHPLMLYTEELQEDTEQLTLLLEVVEALSLEDLEEAQEEELITLILKLLGQEEA